MRCRREVFGFKLRLGSFVDTPSQRLLAIARKRLLGPAVAALFVQPQAPSSLGRRAALCGTPRDVHPAIRRSVRSLGERSADRDPHDNGGTQAQRHAGVDSRDWRVVASVRASRFTALSATYTRTGCAVRPKSPSAPAAKGTQRWACRSSTRHSLVAARRGPQQRASRQMAAPLGSAAGRPDHCLWCRSLLAKESTGDCFGDQPRAMTVASGRKAVVAEKRSGLDPPHHRTSTHRLQADCLAAQKNLRRLLDNSSARDSPCAADCSLCPRLQPAAFVISSCSLGRSAT